jgi:hypothetical protein
MLQCADVDLWRDLNVLFGKLVLKANIGDDTLDAPVGHPANWAQYGECCRMVNVALQARLR